MDGLLIKVTLILKVNLLFELLKPVISYLYLLEFKVTKFQFDKLFTKLELLI